ncbi:hypothetical protein [Ekhidna sp.]|uniref:hypothetical protein n=1 Tax=Ekhidna sp. TaxID=2608089 RepID=UPI003297DAD8
MKIVITIFMSAFLLASCKSDDHNVSSDQDVIINEALYNEISTTNYSITEAEISGDSLKVTIQSSGCDGSEWEVKLVDSGAIAESYPVQRFAKISLKNAELCDAIVTRNYSFNLTPLQVEDQLYLNLEGWESQLHYDF